MWIDHNTFHPEASTFVVITTTDTVDTVELYEYYKHGTVLGTKIIFCIQNRNMVPGTLEMSFRDTDTICRIGGDEFVIFVKDCMPESIEAISGRLENNLIKSNALYNRDPENPSLSFSFGVAIHTEGDFDITEIFKTADERMYRKKRERNMTV